MTANTINPLTDSRWQELLNRHPSASVFHTPGWLSALQRTYGYEPTVVTTCASNESLTNGLAFCRVKSRLTGARWVSLPFSDHCEPLASTSGELGGLLDSFADLVACSRCRYAELRPAHVNLGMYKGYNASDRFFQHELFLTTSHDEIFGRFNTDSIQRKVRRAEREHLSYEEGRSERLISEFYRLLIMTRRRHHLPPQPIAWFRELIFSLGERLKVRVAFKNGVAIASIITLGFRDTMVYKYGGSDARYHSLGGMPMLLWRAIEEAISDGLSKFDFCRSDLENEGLTIFKDRWGTTKSVLTYWTTPAAPNVPSRAWQSTSARRVFSYAPNWLLALSGRLLYKHIG